jgi:hypothetical protein
VGVASGLPRGSEWDVSYQEPTGTFVRCRDLPAATVGSSGVGFCSPPLVGGLGFLWFLICMAFVGTAHLLESLLVAVPARRVPPPLAATLGGAHLGCGRDPGCPMAPRWSWRALVQQAPGLAWPWDFVGWLFASRSLAWHGSSIWCVGSKPAGPRPGMAVGFRGLALRQRAPGLAW